MNHKKHNRTWRKKDSTEVNLAQEQRLITGYHAIYATINKHPKQIEEIIIADSADTKKTHTIKMLAQQHQIKVKILSHKDIDTQYQINQTALIARAKPFEYADLKTELHKLKSQDKALIVVLDHLQDAHNLGAIIRSACGFLADLIVIPKDRAASINAHAEKASAGATAMVPIAQVTNIKRALDDIKENGFWSVGALLSADTQTLDSFKYPEKTVLVIGNEEKGIAHGILEEIDYKVKIPISEQLDSLNASNAAAIMLYEYRRTIGKR